MLKHTLIHIHKPADNLQYPIYRTSTYSQTLILNCGVFFFWTGQTYTHLLSSATTDLLQSCHAPKCDKPFAFSIRWVTSQLNLPWQTCRHLEDWELRRVALAVADLASGKHLFQTFEFRRKVRPTLQQNHVRDCFLNLVPACRISDYNCPILQSVCSITACSCNVCNHFYSHLQTFCYSL